MHALCVKKIDQEESNMEFRLALLAVKDVEVSKSFIRNCLTRRSYLI